MAGDRRPILGTFRREPGKTTPKHIDGWGGLGWVGVGWGGAGWSGVGGLVWVGLGWSGVEWGGGVGWGGPVGVGGQGKLGNLGGLATDSLLISCVRLIYLSIPHAQAALFSEGYIQEE